MRREQNNGEGGGESEVVEIDAFVYLLDLCIWG
jgi:hypothetical protein